MTIPRLLTLVMLMGLLTSCGTNPPLPTVDNVDLPRFMGSWFVIAHIPASSEANAFNGVESYELRPDGRIATTYVFRDGGFDGPLEVKRPVGTVWNEQTNAEWGMQFIWPFKAEFLITYLDAGYETTIIARTARDYAWIMARRPDIGEERYQELVLELERQGYDTSRLRRVPQRWPDPAHPNSP